jgi:hypothetical protein
VQYTVTRALFFPVLALVLLVFNGRATWVGTALRNRPLAVIALVAIVLFFSYARVRPYLPG